MRAQALSAHSVSLRSVCLRLRLSSTRYSGKPAIPPPKPLLLPLPLRGVVALFNRSMLLRSAFLYCHKALSCGCVNCSLSRSG